MSNNKPHTKIKNNSQRPNLSKNKPTLKDVRQDKRAFHCARIASSQPVTVKNDMRTRRLNNFKLRSQKKDVNKKRSARLTLYIKPIVWAEIQRIALERGVSFNEVGAILLEEAMKQEAEAESIEPLRSIVERIVSKEIQKLSIIAEVIERQFVPKKPLRRKN